MALRDYPVDYSAPEPRAVLGILAETYFRTDDIVRILQDSRLPPHEVDLDGATSRVWRSAFDLAAGLGKVDALLDTVEADKPQLSMRLGELRESQTTTRDDRPPEGRVDYTADSWKNFSDDGVPEAIIVAGQPTFVDVAFLALGLQRARSVCRLATHFPAEGSGTAFRVGPRHLLTNHHVLFDHDHADRRVKAVEAWFDYQTGLDGKLGTDFPQLRCLPDTIVGEKTDDWAMVETDGDIPPEYPALPLDGAVPEIDDRVYIIQHPYGLPKKVAFGHNLVRAVMPDRFQYWTDTDIGSSGSPVFDEEWRVVGLHHFSVTAPPGDRISVRNQGRRIDRVVERMRALDVLPVP